MIVLAIDPGFDRCGYSVFRKSQGDPAYLASGLIQTKKAESTESRLAQICDSIDQTIESYKPDIIVIEQLFFFKNQKTVVAVAQAQGAIMLVAARRGIAVKYLTPLQIKQTVTGYGHADKKSVQKMLRLTLKLNGELEQDDQADAIAAGLAYCYMSNKLT